MSGSDLHCVIAISALEILRQFVNNWKIHPILVNFTAALIPVSVLSDIVATILDRQTLRDTGWWTLCYAAAVTPLTALSGWLFWAPVDDQVTGMLIHKWLGTVLSLLVLGLVGWRWWFFRKGRWPGILYLLAGSAAVAALVYQGHLGGEQTFSM